MNPRRPTRIECGKRHGLVEPVKACEKDERIMGDGRLLAGAGVK